MRKFTVGQRIICEMDLCLESEVGNNFRFFTAGNEYTVSRVTPGGNIACRNDCDMEHFFGLDAEDDPSWSNHFRAAHVEAFNDYQLWANHPEAMLRKSAELSVLLGLQP